jgi:uncharacterized membrane protein YsdA (DUF1294 family)
MMIIAVSILSIITFGAYGYDKLAARRAGGRISEATLHLLALCGGWPGALAGQLLFRHKTRKTSFRICFWLTVLVNGAMMLYWRGHRL